MRTVLVRHCGALLVLAVIAAVALGASGCGSSGDVTAQAGHGAGAVLPLQGQTLSGEAYDLAQHAGKPTVVNFFASWCGPCRAEAADLADFAEAHPEVQFVGVAVNDELPNTKAFVEEYGITYPVVVDADGQIGSAWGVNGIPATYFLDAGGAQRALLVGASTRDQFEEKLKSVQ